jgi:hypothetical protein
MPAFDSVNRWPSYEVDAMIKENWWITVSETALNVGIIYDQHFPPSTMKLRMQGACGYNHKRDLSSQMESEGL